MSDQLVAINCSRDLRFEGSEVSGTVNLDTTLAREKEISAIKVSLKGWIHTWVQVSTGQSTYKARDNEPLFKFEATIWTPETAIPDQQYRTITLPFRFVLPKGASSLPPSFHSGNWTKGGRIQYYVHVVAEKPAWYKRNTRVNAPFPFLPLDRSSAPTLRFDDWSGPWTNMEKSVDVRQNALKIFGGQGSVDATINLPRVDSLPLFTRIPCQIKVICSSKPMSSSSSTDPSSFTFPRNPKMTDIQLELNQRVRVKAKIHHRSFNESFGLLGGFGTMENLANIRTETTEPVWVPDEEKPDKGRWTESITYTGYLILRCPTPINTHLIQTELSIDAKIDFPGIGNSWKASLGPLPISSGVAAPPQAGGDQGEKAYDIAVPPSYWDVMAEEDVDEKDTEEKKGLF